jgi:hypothetical protein
MNSKALAWTLVAVSLGAGCKPGRTITILDRDLPPRSPEKVLERVLANDPGPTRYYSAKANVELSMPDGARSFKAQLRSVQDSAAWVSIIPALGIEVARVLMTPDSLKLLDKVNDHYFLGDSAATQQRFGLRPTLTLLQRALQGLPVGLDPNEKYRSDREEGHYVLTSKEKRRFVRAAEDIAPGDTLDRDRDMGDRRLERTLRKAEEKEAIVHRFWVEPDSFRVARVQISDLVHDRIADVRYEERGGAEAHFLPTRIRITLSEGERQATGILELSKISTEGPLSLPFRVPEKFTPLPATP